MVTTQEGTMKRYLFPLIALLTTLAYGQSERSLVNKGNNLYNDTKFSDAEVNYRKALEKNKESKQGIFNLGDALYKQGRFGEAAEQYASSASRSNDPKMKADAYFNLGNSLLKSQKIQESISAYEQALKNNPKDFDTKYNLEYARALLRQQQQQKNDQKKDKNQQQKDQKKNQKDQQKQDQQQQQNQAQQDQKKQQDQLQNPKKGQISKQDAERILQALNNQEKDVQKKLHQKPAARVKVEKDW